MAGWTGKLLRVDLTTGRSSIEDIPREWLEEYIGGRGLADRYLYEEMDPTVDPLSPENKLIFATGPLTGTSASTGGRYSVITKGALTGATACSNSGGYWGGELRLAGWDMILITGKAKTPVYLHIEDDKAELLDARKFIWGESVWETEARIKERHQDGRIRIASIGRAGESLARYACIINDLDRAAGRSGVGAVMGSKNLKAIAVRGTTGVQVKDPDFAGGANDELLIVEVAMNQGCRRGVGSDRVQHCRRRIAEKLIRCWRESLEVFKPLLKDADLRLYIVDLRPMRRCNV